MAEETFAQKYMTGDAFLHFWQILKTKVILRDVDISDEDLDKLHDLQGLEAASPTTLGLVKVGDGLNISDDGTLSTVAANITQISTEDIDSIFV